MYIEYDGHLLLKRERERLACLFICLSRAGSTNRCSLATYGIVVYFRGEAGWTPRTLWLRSTARSILLEEHRIYALHSLNEHVICSVAVVVVEVGNSSSRGSKLDEQRKSPPDTRGESGRKTGEKVFAFFTIGTLTPATPTPVSSPGLPMLFCTLNVAGIYIVAMKGHVRK